MVNNGFQPVACQTVNNGLYMVMNNGLLMVIIWLMMVNHNLVGGIPTYPSEKPWSESQLELHSYYYPRAIPN